VDDLMENRILLLIGLSTILAVACGCLTTGVSPPAPSPSPALSMAAPLTIQINATPSRYNPAMSSTIGIRLTPVNISGIIPSDARFTWETTFGSFYYWGPPDFKVTELGARYTGTEEPVYWSYFSEHGEKERRSVTLSLTVWDPSTRTILANASLGVGWEDPLGFTAVVENSE
jgi:hypothetical protein